VIDKYIINSIISIDYIVYYQKLIQSPLTAPCLWLYRFKY